MGSRNGNYIKLLVQARKSRTWYTGKFSEAQARVDLILIQMDKVEMSSNLLSKKWQWSKDRAYKFIAKQGNQQGNTKPIISKGYKINKETNKETKEPKYGERAQQVLDYLNLKLDKNYRKNDEIIFRLKDGYTVKDCNTIIDNKIQDPYFIKNPRYLNPVTLFRQSHFDVYLNDIPPKTPQTGPHLPEVKDMDFNEDGAKLRDLSKLSEMKGMD